MAQIGENGDVEVDPVHPGLHQGVARDLQGDGGLGPVGVGGVADGGQLGLQLGGLGRGPCAASGSRWPPTGRPAAARMPAQQRRDRRLAVGAGDPDHQQLRATGVRRTPPPRWPWPAGSCPRPPWPGGRPGRGDRHEPLAHQADGPALGRRRRVVVPVGPVPGKAAEQVAGARPAGCRARCRGRRRRKGRPPSRARRSRRATGSSARDGRAGRGVTGTDCPCGDRPTGRWYPRRRPPRRSPRSALT